jgi:hypothetical protein
LGRIAYSRVNLRHVGKHVLRSGAPGAQRQFACGYRMQAFRSFGYSRTKMNQFDSEVTEAFLLYRLDWFVERAIELKTQQGKAGYKWNGLFNAKSPPLGLPEPPDGIKQLIEATGAPTWKDFAEQVHDKVKEHNGRIIFTLLISAFEGRLERLGYATTLTLGMKIAELLQREQALSGAPVHDEIAGSILEIVNRRNDLVHADGMVRQDYLDKHSGRVAQAYWIKKHGWPTVGSQHDFDLEYLYYAATVLSYYAAESPTA